MAAANTSINAGELDRRITLETAIGFTDAFNNPQAEWLPRCTVWAAKEDVSDSERARADEPQAVIDTRFRIRWSGQVLDLEANMAQFRVRFGPRIYQIRAVKEIGRRVGLELSCAARAETPTP